MRTSFSAVVWQEDDLFIAQCLEVDVASQGHTEAEAVDNLREALELFFEDADEVVATRIVRFEVQVGAA